MPDVVLAYLLKQNGSPLISWGMVVDDDEGRVGFLLNYFAIAAGLHESIFKVICETMVKEVYAFDEKMRKAGLLR